MSGALRSFLTLDLMPLTAAVLAAVSCGLLGNFLVLRRQSLLGDAISHSVLPGIVVAFLLSGHRSPVLMLLGAGGASLLSVAIIGVVRRIGRVEPGAAMGVVFSVFFAMGVYLMQQAARNVDLDADCVLYGQLEGLVWFPGEDAGSLLSLDTLALVPRQVVTLAAVTALAAGFTVALFKELRLMSFDPALAGSLGFRPGWLGAGLLALVAAATVAAFEAVGSILVIAMLICPAATARLLTDRLRTQIWLSAAIACAGAVLGYFAGTRLAPALGVGSAVNAAGSIATAAGMLFVCAALLAPTHGVIARGVHRRALARRVAIEDLLGLLYRLGEREVHAVAEADALRGSATTAPGTIEAAAARGLVRRAGGRVSLTEAGTAAARELVRRHRLWESYLVERAGLLPDHVHERAEALEHHLGVGPGSLPGRREVDPHGKEIPGGVGAPPG